MKAVIVLFLILMGWAWIFTVPDDELKTHCHDRGVAKVVDQAKTWNCELQSQIRIEDIDNRWWNPSKYLLFSAEARNCSSGDTTVRKLVQHYGTQCF